MTRKERAGGVLRRLKKTYPVTGPFTNWSNPLELVVATMLSAQCTDARVNATTPKLFSRYKTAKEYAQANRSDLEKLVYSCGYYKSKAKYLQGIGVILERDFSGKVPGTLPELLTLPGISKKSAYIILAKAFGKYEGVPVDTHVFRVGPRIGLSHAKTREKVSEDLAKIISEKDQLSINEYLITHGRAICVPGTPKCGECVLREICPSSKKFL